ncbi:MAG: AAA family ATPase [Caldilineaceae bacterium]|nr:AAA family ATPase [Caldilineaceae bacterium]
MNEPAIILITGIMAAGKSTIAQALAERLPKSVHLRGDLFRRMIVNGRADMGIELSPEALAQLNLRYAIATEVAPLYLAAGFTVVYQDIIIAETLATIVEKLRPHPLYVVVLCPDPTIVATREAGRGKQGYGQESDIVSFDQILRSATAPIGLWLDTSALTVTETVDAILAQSIEAKVN